MLRSPGNDKDKYAEDMDKLKKYFYEIGAIRPPSEGGSASLLIRATRNCPWSKCGFCYGTVYNREKFEIRPVEEIKTDIDTVKAFSDELIALSNKLGYEGKMWPLGIIIQSSLRYDPGEEVNFQCLSNVFNWLGSGGKTVFLQDADTPIMPTNKLVEVIKYLKDTFPSIERITSYSRSKTIAKKKLEDLKQLYQAGLSRLHIGLETGDDELLDYICKGVTAEEHVLAGKKALEAGFELSEYVMPGLGGKSRWEQHARNTALVLNKINPHFIRSRPFVPRAGTPMYEAYQRGEFELTSPHERLEEIKLFVENLEVTSRVCFDHNLNPSYRVDNNFLPLFKQDYDGYKFPEEKETVLDLINKGLKIEESAYIHARDMISLPSL